MNDKPDDIGAGIILWFVIGVFTESLMVISERAFT